VSAAKAYAKINLALVVGPRRPDGLHEVATVLQRVELHDDVDLEHAGALVVEGFSEDTLVRTALQTLAATAGVAPRWRARITKRIPVASGLGGGSSDAAAALRLANAALAEPLREDELHRIAAGLGADVPFFLRTGPQHATAAGDELTTLDLPLDYAVLLVLPAGRAKVSTAAVYQAFDERDGAGFDERAAALTESLARVRAAHDLAQLPPNDLASSPLAATMLRHGAFRADVSGAGPVVYGLFASRREAEQAEAVLRGAGQTWLTRPIAGR
jgi:4-diphosphocytidyl-2-C-methyl-D-erythritol kinase